MARARIIHGHRWATCNGITLSRRLDLLIKQFKRSEAESAAASGIDEDPISEKDRLLSDIIDDMDARKMAKRKKGDSEEKDAAATLRDEALKTMLLRDDDSSDGGDGTSSSCRKSRLAEAMILPCLR
ncbi:hypothetical protein BJV82DRAFT_584616 [Fennellomyces sp. T-0311]|nr:hypothetical protein BJV82DRAFT_584616 [Fennellomyces sp. T-0311]